MLIGRNGKQRALIALIACGLLIALASTATGRSQPPAVEIPPELTKRNLVLTPPLAHEESTPTMTEELIDLLAAVLGDTEDTWHALFEASGGFYSEPTLVLFSGEIPTVCGDVRAAASPVYCMRDQRIYIDPGFYSELRDGMGTPGDTALAYLLAREVGRHVQMLLGISGESRAARQQLPQVEADRLSLMKELQADCFAGVWAHHAHEGRHLLGEAEINEMVDAASGKGTDPLRRERLKYSALDGIRLGTPEQRVRWFRTGLAMGEVQACDTYNAVPR